MIFRNSLFVGLPFFLIGVLIRESKVKISHYSALLFIVIGIFFLLLQIPEYQYIYYFGDKLGDIYISTIIGTPLLLYGLSKFQINYSNQTAKKYHIDKLNFGIYIFHTAIGVILQPLLHDNIVLIYLIALIFSYIFILTTSFLINKIKEHNHNRKIATNTK